MDSPNRLKFWSFADMRVTNNDVWADAAMQYAVYSLFTAVMLLVFVECGNAVYHLWVMVR